MMSARIQEERGLLIDRWTNAARSRRYVLYTGLTGTASVLGFIKGAAFARILGDLGYGYYALAVLTTSYLMYPMTVGLKDGLLRNASILFGVGGEKSLRSLRDQVFTSILGVGLIVGGAFAVVAWNLGAVDADTRLTLALAAALSVTTVLFNVLVVDVQARQRVVALGASLAGRQFFTIALGVAVAGAYGFAGVIVAECIALALMSAAIILASPDKVRIARPRPEALAEVFRIGLPLAGDALMRNVSVSIDKWFVSLFLGIQALGQYAFASIALAGALAANTIMMQVLGPKWLSEFGRTGDLATVHLEIRRVVAWFGGGVVLASALLGPLALPLLEELFPGYEAGLTVLPAVWTGVCLQVVNLFHWTAIAAGRGKTLMKLSIITNASIIAACAVGAIAGAGLGFYAWTFSGGRILSFCLNWGLSRRLAARSE